MANIRDYLTTAINNITLFPENMQRSDVNDSARELQANVKEFADELPFYEFTDTISYVSATSFSSNGDVTALLPVGSRVRAQGASTGTIDGRVSGVSEAGGVTTVTVVWDSGSLANEPLQVWKNVAGATYFATQAEAQAGTDTHKPMNSLRTRENVVSAFTADQTLAATGSQTIPGGLIFKWGSFNPTGSTFNLTFDDAFPSACFQVFATAQFNGDTGGTGTGVALRSDPTVTGVSFSTSSGMDAVRWHAIGN